MLSLRGDLSSHSGEQAAAKDHIAARTNHNRKVGDLLCPRRVAPWLAREQCCMGNLAQGRAAWPHPDTTHGRQPWLPPLLHCFTRLGC